MIALTIEYKRLHSFGNYENEQIGITVIVEPGETPDQALERAKKWVDSQIGSRDSTRDELDRIQSAIYDQKQEQKRLCTNIENLKERRDRAVAILQKHGVDTNELEEIPF